MFRNLYKGWKNKGKTQQSDKEDRKEEVFHQKSLNLCFEDERRSYGFGTTCASN